MSAASLTRPVRGEIVFDLGARRNGEKLLRARIVSGEARCRNALKRRSGFR